MASHVPLMAGFMALSRVTYTDRLSFAGEEEFVTFLDSLGYIEVRDPKAFTRKFLGNELTEDVGK